jgi:hypothetical protein
VYGQHRLSAEGGFVSHTENEYLESLAEHGLAGALLLLAAAAGAAAQARWSARSRELRPAVLAAAGATAVAAAHALFDFPMRIPLYAVAWASVAGLALAHPLRGRGLLGGPAARLAAGAALVTALALAPLWRRMDRMDSPRALPQAPADELAGALAWAPTFWPAWYYLGRAAVMDGRPPAVAFGLEGIGQAAACDPQNYRLWLAVGEARLRTGDRRGAREAFARAKALRAWLTEPPGLAGGGP